jgi:hypothetical protein
MSERKLSGPFPADLLSLLAFPATVIVYAVVPFRFSWAAVFAMALVECWLGASLIQQRRSSPSGWLMLAIGIGLGAAAAFLLFLQMRRTI